MLSESYPAPAGILSENGNSLGNDFIEKCRNPCSSGYKDSLSVCEATKQMLSESYPAPAGILSESPILGGNILLYPVAILVLVDNPFGVVRTK